tara:strand:+ start:1440 stop:1910 length:471 start_codon:yes stop_codon:yes gene_type:complete
MTNSERRKLLIDFMRRHELDDGSMAKLIGRDRYWVCRARNNYTSKGNEKGDFTIPQLVSSFLLVLDLLPAGIQRNVIAGDFPTPTPDISLARLRPDEVAEHQTLLDETCSALLHRFAAVLDGSSSEVLRRAANQLVALEMAKKRITRDLHQPQAAE